MRCPYNVSTNAHATLTTGTFNLIVKDRTAFRLSGALSGPPGPLRESVRPRNLLTLSCGCKCCQPFVITGFPPVIHNGECPLGSIRARKTQARDTSQPIQPGDSAATLFRLGWRCVFGACRSGRRSNLKRSLGRFCFSRNPSGTFVPECGSRDPGSIIEAC